MKLFIEFFLSPMVKRKFVGQKWIFLGGKSNNEDNFASGHSGPELKKTQKFIYDLYIYLNPITYIV